MDNMENGDNRNVITVNHQSAKGSDIGISGQRVGMSCYTQQQVLNAIAKGAKVYIIEAGCSFEKSPMLYKHSGMEKAIQNKY